MNTTNFVSIQNLSGNSPFPLDILVGPNSSTAWVIDGLNSGYFSTPALGIVHLAFTGMEQLMGGSASDEFAFETTGKISGVGASLTGIVGGGGSNTIEGPGGANATDWRVSGILSGSIDPGAGSTNFTFIEMLAGRSSQDTLTGRDFHTTWNITAHNAGNMNTTDITFSGMENLVGGTANDEFVFSEHVEVSGSIYGGGGSNTLNYSSYITTPLIVNLATGAATNISGGVSAIQTVIAAQGANTLTASATEESSFEFLTNPTGASTVLGNASQSDTILCAFGPNTWNITTTDGGNVGNITFTNVKNLAGGNIADVFTFSDGQGLGGTILGGAGTNTLDYHLYTSPVAVNLAANTASNVAAGIFRVQKVIAGQNANILTASATIDNVFEFPVNPAAASTVTGNGGLFDTLICDSGSNIWTITATNNGHVGNITFTGIKNLTGGSGDDLFILNDGQGLGGVLDGGGGFNILSYYHYTGVAYAKTPSGPATNIAGGIRNIQEWIPPDANLEHLKAALDVIWTDMTQIDNYNFGGNGYLQISPWDQKWVEQTKRVPSISIAKRK